MSEKCRLCLKLIPNESVIKLYIFLHETTEAAEMVKLIAKYLHIKVKKDDTVSTIICQDCNDHLEDFHKFSEEVAAKQQVLQNELSAVDLKVESPHSEDNTEDKNNSTCLIEEEVVENKISADEQGMLKCPIDVVKDELDSDQEDADFCIQDMLEADIFESDGEEYKPMQEDMREIQSSDDDMPLIKLKTRKNKNKNLTTTTSRNKKKRAVKKPKQPKKSKPKAERPPKISGQQLIAASLELKCDICQTQVSTWKELRQHFLLAHTRTPYIKCCDTVYDKQRPLVDHLQWHKNPDAFKCQLCEENFKTSRDLTTHISNAHPDNVDVLQHYECEHCFKHFRSFTIYKNHLRTHNKDSDVECQICNKRYTTVYQLRRHIDSFHKGVYFHMCDICGKNFKCKDSFKKHIQSHQGIVDQAVQCSICKTWLKNENSLRLHRFVHEEHHFTCEHCDTVFKSRRRLQRHVSYWHTLDLNLTCTMCDKVFRQKRNLDEHMATHTGVQLYTCPHCGKESRSRSNMYVHVKRIHPNEWWKSKIERFNLDPNTENPELKKKPIDSEMKKGPELTPDVFKVYTHFLCK